MRPHPSPAGLPGDFLKEIAGALPADSLLTALPDRIAYSMDATRREYLPGMVVRPGDAGEVEEVVRLCDRHRVPVTARGGGTGFTGGALAVRGGVVLDMTRMGRILEIDPVNLLAVVEPGVRTAIFQAEVEAQGLFYPPDPASAAVCAIGGNVAEDAGGPRAMKYGVTRHYVLGLEVVTPRHGRLRTGVRTLKGVVGYDLTRLLVGSEGTLGIFTEITLRLIPRPGAVGTLRALFDSEEAVGRLVPAIVRRRVLPSACEFMDGTCLRLLNEEGGFAFPPDAAGLVIIEVDGSAAGVEEQLEEAGNACREVGAREVRAARDPAERAALWGARKALSPIVGKQRPTKINEDVVVPRDRIVDLLGWVRGLAKESGLFIVNFGHIGDGNIHVNIMTDEADPEEYPRALKAVERLFAKVLELGGTISGEHGVGIAKADYLRMELPEKPVSLMMDLKRVFDPNDIMNPGKIFYGSPRPAEQNAEGVAS